MLRITPFEIGDHRIALRVEGRVSGPWVSELRMACETAIRAGTTLVLNLAEVSFVDYDGVALLKGLGARGVEMADCSVFVKEQLKAAGLELPQTGNTGDVPRSR